MPAPRWDEIAGIFSRDAILKGAFDRFAEAREGKRGTAEVDTAFLAETEGWRDALAHNLALRRSSMITIVWGGRGTPSGGDRP